MKRSSASAFQFAVALVQKFFILIFHKTISPLWTSYQTDILSVTANQNAFRVSESKRSPLDSNFIIWVENLIFFFQFQSRVEIHLFCWDECIKKSFQVCNFCSSWANITLPCSNSVSTESHCDAIFNHFHRLWQNPRIWCGANDFRKKVCPDSMESFELAVTVARLYANETKNEYHYRFCMQHTLT